MLLWRPKSAESNKASKRGLEPSSPLTLLRPALGQTPGGASHRPTTTCHPRLLKIVSARGRALPLFEFEYLWEVYKPPEQRRWGYYTLPLLYRDRLVARADLKLERTSKTLVVKGFWLENHAVLTDQFMAALARAFKQFMRFIDAEALDRASLSPTDLREGVEKLLNMPE